MDPPPHSDHAGPHCGQNCADPGFHCCLALTVRPQTFGSTRAPDLALSDPTLPLFPVAQYSHTPQYLNSPALPSTPVLPLSPVPQYSRSPQYPSTPALTSTPVLPLSPVPQYSRSHQYPNSPTLPSTPVLPFSPVLQLSHSPQYPSTPTLPSSRTLSLSPVPRCIKRRRSHSDRSQVSGR